MQCVHFTPVFAGKTNDKDKADNFLHALRSNKLFTECTFKVKGSDGDDIVLKGVFVLSDGGYNQW